MSSVNVVYLGEFACCWDQQFLRSLFDGNEWLPPCAPHYNIVRFEEYVPDGEGVILIVPARYFAGALDVAEINAFIEELPWVFFIGTSDEEGLFPYDELVHDNLKIWAMTPHPRHYANVRTIGEFYPIAVKEAQQRNERKGKSLDWFFAGQVTHERRKQLSDALWIHRNDVIPDHPPFGDFIETPGFTQGLEQQEYYDRMADAKVVPCPAGPATPDSFRFYEALELGAVPIADDCTPGDTRPGFWHAAYDTRPGASYGDLPFPVVRDWNDAPQIITNLVANYPVANNRVTTWWQQEKRLLAHDVMDAVTLLSGKCFPEVSVADNVTIIIPTSPIPSHPSISIITDTIASIRAYPELVDAEIIIVCDGVPPMLEHRRADYEESIRRLIVFANLNRQVVVKRMEEWGHQANATKFALEDVTTPLVLFVEHDMLLIGPIPWGELVPIVKGPETHVMRFHFEAFIPDPHHYLMIDMIHPNGIPLMRTFQWSQRPHLAKTDKYREWIYRYFGRESRTMIEDLMHGVVQALPWDEFRLTLYHEKVPALGIKRSITSDGRGDDPKGDMSYEYDGETPYGAPAPTSQRVD